MELFRLKENEKRLDYHVIHSLRADIVKGTVEDCYTLVFFDKHEKEWITHTFIGGHYEMKLGYPEKIVDIYSYKNYNELLAAKWWFMDL